LLARLIVPEVLSQAGAQNRIPCPKCGASRSRYCCMCLLPIGPASCHPVPLLAPFKISIIQHRLATMLLLPVFLCSFRRSHHLFSPGPKNLKSLQQCHWQCSVPASISSTSHRFRLLKLPTRYFSRLLWCILSPANDICRLSYSHHPTLWTLIRWTGVLFATLWSSTAHGSEPTPCYRCRRFPVCVVSSFRSSAPHFGGTITKQMPACQLARLFTIFFVHGAPAAIPRNGTGDNSTVFCFTMRILSRAFRTFIVLMLTKYSSERKTTSHIEMILEQTKNQVKTHRSALSCNSLHHSHYIEYSMLLQVSKATRHDSIVNDSPRLQTLITPELGQRH
jgi:hypothetical protein